MLSIKPDCSEQNRNKAGLSLSLTTLCRAGHVEAIWCSLLDKEPKIGQHITCLSSKAPHTAQIAGRWTAGCHQNIGAGQGAIEGSLYEPSNAAKCIQSGLLKLTTRQENGDARRGWCWAPPWANSLPTEDSLISCRK